MEDMCVRSESIGDAWISDLTRGHVAVSWSVWTSTLCAAQLSRRWQMRRSLWLFALFILAGSSSRAIAQARQAGVSRSSQYTLPANVVKAAMAAYKRHDIDAAYAY